MTKSEVLHHIHSVGVMPVLRAESEEQAIEIASAIADGGVTCIEVTMTVPGAIKVISKLLKSRPELLIGAGTVLDPETARICMLEGAQFIVSPSLNTRTVEMCRRYSVAVIPGALTPTEVVAAWDCGADIVKIFPVAAVGGAKYLTSISAPLPQISFIPSGGVNVGTSLAYLEAGAYALGAGADLVNVAAIKNREPHKITEVARKYVSIVKGFRETAKA